MEKDNKTAHMNHISDPSMHRMQLLRASINTDTGTIFSSIQKRANYLIVLSGRHFGHRK